MTTGRQQWDIQLSLFIPCLYFIPIPYHCLFPGRPLAKTTTISMKTKTSTGRSLSPWLPFICAMEQKEVAQPVLQHARVEGRRSEPHCTQLTSGVLFGRQVWTNLPAKKNNLAQKLRPHLKATKIWRPIRARFRMWHVIWPSNFNQPFWSTISSILTKLKVKVESFQINKLLWVALSSVSDYISMKEFFPDSQTGSWRIY